MSTMSTAKLLNTTPLTLADVRDEINARLHAYFQQRTTQAERMDTAYARLWQTTADLALAGGKRLRPYITILGYQAFAGGSKLNDAIFDIAIAQELLHLSLLIHDDIIDRDYQRYGRANVAGSMQAVYRELATDDATSQHFANSAALLAGDLLIADAHHYMLRGSFAESARQTALNIFRQGIFAVAGGELLDTEAALHSPADVDSLAIAQHKTASYSVVTPICIGAALAGADDSQLTQFRTFAEHVGIAYQLVDDILGVFGTAQTTGKSTTSDIQEGKRTYLIQQTFIRASKADQTVLGTILGNPTATNEDVQRVQTIMINCGAKQQTEHVIEQHKTAALALLADIRMQPAIRDALAQLLHAALHRTK